MAENAVSHSRSGSAGAIDEQRVDLGGEPELIADSPVEERNLAHRIPDGAEADPVRFDADETIAPLEHLQRLRRAAVTEQEPAAADLDRRAVDVVEQAGDLQSAVTMDGKARRRAT